MDEASFQRWLDDYIEAWKTYDRDRIEALFNEDVRYRYHPWDEPVEGRKTLVDDWLGDQDAPGSWAAEYSPWLVNGEQAVAVGVSRYFAADGTTVDREYHNVFLCRFDGDGRCREFTEIFLRRPDES